MVKAALVSKRDGTVVGSIVDTGRPQWIVDPGTGRKLASPAVIGWQNDDYRLCEFIEVSIPKGKRIVGEKTCSYDSASSTVIERAVFEAMPAARVLTDSEKLERATGMTIAQIKAVLA